MHAHNRIPRRSPDDPDVNDKNRRHPIPAPGHAVRRGRILRYRSRTGCASLFLARVRDGKYFFDNFARAIKLSDKQTAAFVRIIRFTMAKHGRNVYGCQRDHRRGSSPNDSFTYRVPVSQKMVAPTDPAGSDRASASAAYTLAPELTPTNCDTARRFFARALIPDFVRRPFLEDRPARSWARSSRASSLPSGVLPVRSP
jgi:hypothetical protein